MIPFSLVSVVISTGSSPHAPFTSTMSIRSMDTTNRNIIDNTCIQEIPQHIFTKDVVGSNGIISLRRYIETWERIRLNQIEFLLAIFDSTILISISCYFDRTLSPHTYTSHKEK